MKASQVKEILSEQDIFSLLVEMGGEPTSNGVIVSKTICHNPAHTGSQKLFYYSESKTFHCYTNCGTMDIFGLISKAYNMDFYTSFKYVCSKFGIATRNEDYEKSEIIDNSFFKKFNKKNEIIKLDCLNNKILKSYYELYHDSWIKDGISIQSMKKFDIRYSILTNQIIIPHHDIDGNLIGVRARNLNKDLVDSGKKYMPVYWKRKVLKHPTGAALYGLDKNKNMINKLKTIILFESEKSVLQLDTMMPDNSIGVCISGSSLSNHQLEIIKSLDVEEIVIALDKEFDEVGSEKEKYYSTKVKEMFANKLSPYFSTSVIWDVDNLLDEKDSPTDKGLEVFQKLFKNRINLNLRL